MYVPSEFRSVTRSSTSPNELGERPAVSWRTPSLWWIGVGLLTVAAVLLIVAGFLAPMVSDATVAPFLTTLLPFVVVFFVLLLPYPLLLGLDARAVSAGEYEWTPNPWKWAGLGLLSIGALLLLPTGSVILTALIGGTYLYRRHSTLGVP